MVRLRLGVAGNATAGRSRFGASVQGMARLGSAGMAWNVGARPGPVRFGTAWQASPKDFGPVL